MELFLSNEERKIMTNFKILEEMLASQSRFQEEVIGKALEGLGEKERMEEIRNNVLALTDELHEALGCTGWKPWASSNHLNREQFHGEMVDAWHFFMNLMILSEMSGDDLVYGYFRKLSRNVARQKEGYDGISGKCPKCGKALDDEAVICTLEKCGEDD